MKELDILKTEMLDTLQGNILGYWMEHMIDAENGGFYGRIAGDNMLMSKAEKGGVLNARILWTFASAYRLLKKEEYLETANRAKEYIINHFYDKEFGGIYWSLNYEGKPADTKKQIYAIAFAIYGLSELYRTTADEEALAYAKQMFHSIEKHSFDKINLGYYEAFTREWHEIEDMRLSEKDANESKTMNTHLHILEAYTNLYRVWADDLLKEQLRGLIEVFLTQIIDAETGHLKLFFDDRWYSKSTIDSYGHDIEASWLLHESAIVLGDKEVLARVEKAIPSIVKASSEGLQPDGSMIYESDKDLDEVDRDRHWWVQAEAVVGYLNSYQHFGDNDSLSKALHCWEYIKNNLIDHQNGEWYWSIEADGQVNEKDDKAGFWKCPYHNGRMCMEVLSRFS